MTQQGPRVAGSGISMGFGGPGAASRLDARLDELVAQAERTGDHLWSVACLFKVADPDSDHHDLDLENLVGFPGVGCYICEQPYEPRLRHRRCPGEPKAGR